MEASPPPTSRATAPAYLERFAALCRHLASFADLRRGAPKTGILRNLKDGDRGE